MERFPARLDNKLVILKKHADVVRFSFLVRNSISYLNLHLSEYSKLSDRSRTVVEVANDFVNTEEKCRKIFAPSRSLLYNLNLDMPSKREYRLKNKQKAYMLSAEPSIQHVAKIILTSNFDFRNIFTFIKDALKAIDLKLKILRFLVKSPVFKSEIFRELPPDTINEFIVYFYPLVTDSKLFKSFLEIFNWKEWITKYEEPSILEHLLYYIRYYGIDFVEYYSACFLIDDCILGGVFSNIKPLLMYSDAPRISEYSYGLYMYLISDSILELTEDVLLETEKRIPPQRLYFILQMLYTYFEGHRYEINKNAPEALRLLWNSCPHPFITIGEIKQVCMEVLKEEEIADIYKFYCSSIDESPSVVEPRSLKHLSRVTIRRILKDNGWIPEGVRSTDLPKCLHAYLNLE